MFGNNINLKIQYNIINTQGSTKKNQSSERQSANIVLLGNLNVGTITWKLPTTRANTIKRANGWQTLYWMMKTIAVLASGV